MAYDIIMTIALPTDFTYSYTFQTVDQKTVIGHFYNLYENIENGFNKTIMPWSLGIVYKNN
jgi:hypothetical protein